MTAGETRPKCYEIPAAQIALHWWRKAAKEKKNA